jgi:hypothetical protein
MRRFESQEPELDAWVEIPDEWLSGDYDIYIRAYAEARAADHAHPTCRLAGVLALALKGRVRMAVPGIDLAGEMPDLSGINARAQGFLLQSVALPLELTQVIPFGSSERSATGTTGARKARRAR